MPPKKAKVKVRKSSKTAGGKGVNIKIVIDQSKRTKGQAPKAPAGPRQLPAFSAMPQGPSFLGASYPTRQDTPPVDINVLGDKIFNQLLAEGYRREQSARGFGGFQTAGEQLNQIYDGQYRTTGRGNAIIITEPQESDTNKAIDNAVFDDPQTNNQILGNKLNSRGPSFPNTGSNSISALDEEERRDNALDNLVTQEKKSKASAEVEADLDEELRDEGSTALQEIDTADGQAERAKELALEEQEAQYVGRFATPKIRNTLEETYNLPSYPPTKKATVFELKEYIRAMNEAFGTNYDSNFSGRKAVDDLRRVIRVGLLKAYDDL